MTNNKHDVAISELSTLLSFADEALKLLIDANEDNSGFSTKNLSLRSKKLKALHSSYKQLSTTIFEINKRLLYSDIPAAMEAEGLKTADYIGIGKVTLTEGISCKITDPSLAFATLESLGYGSVIKETKSVHPMTLKATIRKIGKNVLGIETKTTTVAKIS